MRLGSSGKRPGSFESFYSFYGRWFTHLCDDDQEWMDDMWRVCRDPSQSPNNNITHESGPDAETGQLGIFLTFGQKKNNIKL